MRLDEMIIKANADGKTYVNRKDCTTYSASNGFSGEDIASLFNDGWEELPKRHLTVAEAEKELDCVIDTPDISKLFRPMSENPENNRNVILVFDEAQSNLNYCGYFIKGKWFYFSSYMIPVGCHFHWIDPADLIKLLHKE